MGSARKDRGGRCPGGHGGSKRHRGRCRVPAPCRYGQHRICEPDARAVFSIPCAASRIALLGASPVDSPTSSSASTSRNRTGHLIPSGQHGQRCGLRIPGLRELNTEDHPTSCRTRRKRINAFAFAPLGARQCAGVGPGRTRQGTRPFPQAISATPSPSRDDGGGPRHISRSANGGGQAGKELGGHPFRSLTESKRCPPGRSRLCACIGVKQDLRPAIGIEATAGIRPR